MRYNDFRVALPNSKKKALYLGAKHSLFPEVQKTISLIFDVLQEELLPPVLPENTAVIFIEALEGKTEQAAALIPRVKEISGNAALFVFIDHRDPDFLLAANRLGADGFIEVPDDLPNLLSIIHQNSRRQNNESQGEITSFFSLKGGVGRTTLAVNVAQHLSMLTGGKAVLVDLNMPLGDCALYLNSDENQGYSVNDFILNLPRLDEKIIYDSLTRHTSGIYSLGLPTKMEELEHITDTSIKSVLATLRRHFDQVIIDCASDLSPVTLACLDESDNIMLVAEPSLTAMRALKIAHDTCQRLGYSQKRLRLILNRETSLGDEITSELIEALKLPFSCMVENNYLAFLHALQEGKLLHDHSPGCLADRQIKAIADLIFLEEALAADRQPFAAATSSPRDWLKKMLSRFFPAESAMTGARQ